jgi:hypothetical protein
MRCSFLVHDQCRRMLTVDYRLFISLARVQDETLRGIRGGHAAFLLAIKPKRNFQRYKLDAVKTNSFYFGVTIGSRLDTTEGHHQIRICKESQPNEECPFVSIRLLATRRLSPLRDLAITTARNPVEKVRCYDTGL